MWMVRAEQGGRLFDAFREKGGVAIGWHEIGSLADLRSREALTTLVRKQWPDWKPQSVAMAASQINRFRNELQVGDRVVTYNSSRRVYLVGTIKSDYRRDARIDPEDPNVRDVRWDGEVARDLLLVPTKNTLGSLATLFAVPEHAACDIERALKSQAPLPPTETPVEVAEEAVEEEDIFREIQARAQEFIKDRVSRLNWSDMQELVAGLLRAMGYKTRVSPAGPDRGKDIVASPDGFGFQPPRIVVEVKHREKAMGSQEIRSFLGAATRRTRAFTSARAGSQRMLSTKPNARAYQSP
jgi:restriction system protein